jgi:hypothetical protein
MNVAESVSNKLSYFNEYDTITTVSTRSFSVHLQELIHYAYYN